jgi:hypothetical protein
MPTPLGWAAVPTLHVQPTRMVPTSRWKRAGVAAVLVALVVIAFVAWITRASGGLRGTPWRSVVRVELVLIPEGSPPPPFQQHPTLPGYDLPRLAPYAPAVLPAPLDQHGCDQGANMVITLSDGRTAIYGPCRYPAAIAHLWAGLYYVITDGACAPRCGPSGTRGP